MNMYTPKRTCKENVTSREREREPVRGNVVPGSEFAQNIQRAHNIPPTIARTTKTGRVDQTRRRGGYVRRMGSLNIACA